MARSTRQTTRLREAEGIPPSPPTELPTELSGTRRKKPKAPRVPKSVITSETDDEASSSSQQHQSLPDQPLREGNAGGYVHIAPGAESTREQQDSLTDTTTSPVGSSLRSANTSRPRSSGEGIAAPSSVRAESSPTGATHTSPHPFSATPTRFAAPPSVRAGGSPTGATHTSPHSLSATPTRFAAPPSVRAGGSPTGATHTSPHSLSATPTRFAASPSVRADGSPTGATPTSPRPLSATSTLFAQVLSPDSTLSDGESVFYGLPGAGTMIEPAATLQSVSPQTDGLAASRATHATDSITLSRTTATTHDISVQTDPRPESFKPLSLYGYNSEISVLPDFCNVTLHLDPDREIRISRVSANAVRRISDILQGEPMSSYERNWLTPGEIAEAQAEAERQQRLAAANKRKRDEDTELPQAQRPRVTPRSTTSAKPMRRMQFMRTSGHPFGRSLAAIRAHPLGDDEAGPYNQNGDLQLSGVTSSDIQDEDPLINATVADPIPSANATADETPHVESSSTNAGTGSTDAQDAEVGTTHTNEQQLQTPRTGSWGFGSLVNSAIRYVPSFGRQRTSQQPVAQTEVRRPATMAGHADFGQRLHSSQAAAQKTFRTKENIAAMKASKAERVRIKEEWARLDEAQKAAEQERLELAEAKRITELEKQDVAEAHRAAIANQPPGSKKRRHSPSVIPNPKGASYGLDLDFFTYSDSSSDEDQEASPSRKSRRISGPDHSRSKTPTINDRTTSLVHGPHASSSERATEYKGSRFSDSPPNVFGQAKIRSSTVISKNDPGFNHRGHFEVPYSSSSSEGDSSSDEEDVATSVVNNPPPLLPLGTHDSSGKESGKVAPAASPQKSATGPEFPPVTPAPKQVAAVPETQRNLEAAKTLQRNREILRAKIAGQNKSVLSPKDIPSPSKVHNTSQAVTQPTPQLTTPAIFFQPPQTSTGAPLTAPSKDDGFSILGAANQKGPKSPARMLAETLPSIQDRVNKLQSYNDFQRAMDPRVKATVESSWDDGDEAATGNDFRNAFLDFSNAHEQDSTRPVLSASHDYQQASDDEATDEEDHASLYADEDNNLDQEQDSDADNGLLNDTDEEQAQGTESEEDNGATVPITGTPSFFGTPPSFEIPPSFDHHWDPVVAAFMKANWTAEDEAAASAEFKTKIASEEA